jgi:hypothetical protein
MRRESGKYRSETDRQQGWRHTKDRGDVTELQFMVETKKRRYPTAKPFGENLHYDVLVDARWKIFRVQVKLGGAKRYNGYAVRSAWQTTHKSIPYSIKDADILAAQIDGKGIWYLIPVRALGGRKIIHLYPFGCARGSRRFEKYLEAWWLLEKKKRRKKKNNKRKPR